MRLSIVASLALSVAGASSFTYNASNSTVPVNFAYLIFPAFANVDVFAPVDALELLSLQSHMNLYFISETLDPVSTKPQSSMMNKSGSNFGTTILPTHTLDSPPPSIDVLLVPGGLGTRAPAPALDRHIQFIGNIYPSLKYLFAICTGAGLAARADVLVHREATTNKRSWNETIVYSNTTAWKAPARWWVDGNIWTTSGETAGLDGILAWMGQVYGKETALSIANGMEHRALDWWEDEFSAVDNVARTYPFGEAPDGYTVPPPKAFAPRPPTKFW